MGVANRRKFTENVSTRTSGPDDAVRRRAFAAPSRSTMSGIQKQSGAARRPDRSYITTEPRFFQQTGHKIMYFKDGAAA